MSDPVIPLPPRWMLPVTGGGGFPVRRVYCVGRNYADHAAEMGHDPNREPPFFFQKNPENLRTDGLFPYPAGSRDVQHEIELMVGLAEGGRDIPTARALGCVWGYGVALDMTARDLQAQAKARGRPWIDAKAFDDAAPCSALTPVDQCGDHAEGAIELAVNGELRQRGNLNQQIWSLPEVIAALSARFTLAAGDIILTGTPAGVAPVIPGDRLVGHIEAMGSVDVTVTRG
ncbi:fumarylacetoacetate hydrolase family protein [Spiribacter roseus]|uniref:fumarylacetoacetate hydrolase family protein n=1 Tax=Spiribacter roseus TaxID=1855875 RepID=UPI00190F444B|nr:fumarylacetoacetate hydrolase family protein [Spiribacter roseus]